MNSLKDAIDTLKNSGLKTTEKREKILKIMYKEDKYLSAGDIQKELEGDYPSISPDTIYRNLHTFVDLDILEQTELEGEKLFRSNCQTHGHHHHFICTNCGKTKEIDQCPLDVFKTNLPGCEITSHRFELYGLCSQCAVA